MLLAIDAGNTHTVFGLWDGQRWLRTWRRSTDSRSTEDEIASWLQGMFQLSGLVWHVDEAVCASVVPPLNDALHKLCERWLGVPLKFIKRGEQLGLCVKYDPPHGVGADRLANAIAALARFKPPIIVVDFGTATTFDVVDDSGSYAGGAILPGVAISSQALADKTANLPTVEFEAPEFAIGRNTVAALQSGIMFGYAGSVDAIVRRIEKELGQPAKVLATGGLGGLFLGLCESIELYEPTLTLEGLVIANDKIAISGA